MATLCFPCPHWCSVLLQLCKFNECFVGEGIKKPMESLLLYFKKTICGARKNVTAFLFIIISLDEYGVNVAETLLCQITMSQEILLNSIISFSESGFSVWRWKKKITFYIHLNWKAAECGGWEPINSRSVTSFLFSAFLAVSSFKLNRKLSIIWQIWAHGPASLIILALSLFFCCSVPCLR